MKAEKQLYLENHTMHEDETYTIMLVRTYRFQQMFRTVRLIAPSASGD